MMPTRELDLRNASRAAERRVLTVLFVDVRRFTAFAEERPPEEALETLNSLFDRLNRVVADHEGMIAKFTGDGMMVLFGAPLTQPDHDRRAVACAIGLRSEARSWNDERRRCGAQALEIGIGVASGEVVCGSLGSVECSEYAVIGSTVNLAARLEERAEGGQILLNPAAAVAVAAEVPMRALGLLWMNGFSKSVSVFEVTDGGTL